MKVIDLTKSFNHRILFSHLSFNVEKGIVLIEGPSGCGKSTLFNILMGLEKPDEGKTSPLSSFSYVGPEPSLFYDLSLIKNTQVFKSIDRKTFNELVQLFHFEPFLNKIMNELSGGERQKAEIIFCLSKITDTFFLDEPFSNLDNESRKILVGYLNQLSKDKIIFLINHDEKQISISPAIRILFKNDGVSVINYSLQRDQDQNKLVGKTLFRPWLAVSSLFHNNSLAFIIQSILILAFCLLFALGTSYVNPKDKYDTYSVSLEADPFAYHSLLGNSDTKLTSDFSSNLVSGSTKRRLYLSTNDLNRGGGYFFDTIDDGLDFTIYYFSPNSNHLFFDGETITLTAVGNNYLYTVKLIDRDNEIITSHKDIQFIQEAIDGKGESQPICFVNHRFIDEVLEYDTSCLKLNKLSINFEPLYSFKYDQGKLYHSSFADLEILSNEGFHLGIPKISNGTKIKVGDSTLYTTEDGSSLTKPSFSKEALIDTLFLVGTKDRSTCYLSVFLNKEAVLITAKEFHLTIDGVIRDYTQGNTQSVLYYALSIITLLFIIIFRFLSFKGEKRSFVSLKKIFAYNQLSRKGEETGVAIFESLKVLPALLISIVLYLFYFIPLANYSLMVQSFPSIMPGYYYYSMEPINSYYDSINQPLTFISYNSLILVLVVICIILILIFLIQDLQMTQEKTDRC